MQLTIHQTAPDVKNHFKNIKAQFIEVGRILNNGADLSKVKSYIAKKIVIVTSLLTEVILGVYTEETFNSLTKRHMIDLFLKIQKQTNSTICKLTDEIRYLNANFKRLESNIQACNKVNNALVKQVASPERQGWRNALHYRRGSVEIIGMSN